MQQDYLRDLNLLEKKQYVSKFITVNAADTGHLYSTLTLENAEMYTQSSPEPMECFSPPPPASFLLCVLSAYKLVCVICRYLCCLKVYLMHFSNTAVAVNFMETAFVGNDYFSNSATKIKALKTFWSRELTGILRSTLTE